MSIDISARVVALELPVDQLILERAQMFGDPAEALRRSIGGVTKLAAGRGGAPGETMGALADVLAWLMNRLAEALCAADVLP